jgi:N-methylhydantoinase A
MTAPPVPSGQRALLDPAGGAPRQVPLYWRAELHPGQHVDGPAVIAETETSTFVSETFRATLDRSGHLLLERQPACRA